MSFVPSKRDNSIENEHNPPQFDIKTKKKKCILHSHLMSKIMAWVCVVCCVLCVLLCVVCCVLCVVCCVLFCAPVVMFNAYMLLSLDPMYTIPLDEMVGPESTALPVKNIHRVVFEADGPL